MRERGSSLPRAPLVGEGRMYALLATERRGMRVLSPRIEPPVSELLGSIVYMCVRQGNVRAGVSTHEDGDFEVLVDEVAAKALDER